MDISARPAAHADAAAACDVIRRSITHLLAAEHQKDEGTLSAWLENKTVENARRWISAHDRYCVVAVNHDRVCGFGMIKRTGEIGLLYVAPEHRFHGASKLMLRALEQQAALWGLKAVAATSSLTARAFYIRCGYEASGEPVKGFGITHGYPVSKRLAP
jgi:GNAT superfamily N-acetyltransferase